MAIVCRTANSIGQLDLFNHPIMEPSAASQNFKLQLQTFSSFCQMGTCQKGKVPMVRAAIRHRGTHKSRRPGLRTASMTRWPKRTQLWNNWLFVAISGHVLSKRLKWQPRSPKSYYGGYTEKQKRHLISQSPHCTHDQRRQQPYTTVYSWSAKSVVKCKKKCSCHGQTRSSRTDVVFSFIFGRNCHYFAIVLEHNGAR